MYNILKRFNIRWQVISLITITLGSGFLIWRQIFLELDIVILSLFLILVIALIFNLIFIFRTSRHLDEVESRDKKVIKLLSKSEESILLTDIKGLVVEVHWNNGSERILGNQKDEIKDINIFDFISD